MRAPNYEFGGCEFESHQSFKIKFARVGELAYPSELGSEHSVGSSPTLGTKKLYKMRVIPLEYNHNDDLYIKIVSKRRFIIKGLCIFVEEKFYLTEIYKDVTYDEFMSALDEVRDFGFDIADQDKYDKLKYENYLRVFSR